LALFDVLSHTLPGTVQRGREEQTMMVLSAQCPPVAEPCSAIRVTGDPHDEEAWGSRARPGADSIWKESQVPYAVGNRMRCDEVRATLQTPSEGCWGPVYFRREGR